MKAIIFLATLFSFTIIEAHSQKSKSESFYGEWYVLFKWYPDTLSNKGVHKVIIEKNNRCVVQYDSTSFTVITWEYDTATNQLLFVYPKRETVYLLDLAEQTMSGHIYYKFKESGLCYVSRVKSLEWEKLNYERIANKKVIKASPYIEYAIRDNKTVRMGLTTLIDYNEYRVSINPELGGLAIQGINSDKHVSSNGLFALSAGLIYAITPKDTSKDNKPYSQIYIYPLLLNILTNFHIAIPLKNKFISLSIQQSTDYYFFYEVSKIVPETKFGIRFDFSSIDLPVQLHTQYCLPWTKGYGSNSDNYFSVSLAGVF